MAYEKRDRDLRATAREAVGATSDETYVDWLIAKRQDLSPSSWRQYRAAAVWRLEKLLSAEPERASTIKELISRLQSTPPAKNPQRQARTSAQKSKRIPEMERIIAAALASSAPHGPALADFLHASVLTGIRPKEWPTACLEAGGDGGWIVTVGCAKRDDVRAHSDERTLRYEQIPGPLLARLRSWLRRVVAAEQIGAFERLLASLSKLLRRITRRLFPLRKKWPTLYSARHEAAARFKAFYIEAHSDPAQRLEGAAIIAALLGHASDVTATKHYGRASRKEPPIGWPIPQADPLEVARVRTKLGADWEKFKAYVDGLARPKVGPK